MLKKFRKLHLWIGLLFAPTLIFFALSGALQVFGLHESEGGQPAPAWIAKLAEIHKDQSISPLPQRRPERTAPAAAIATAAPEQPAPAAAQPAAAAHPAEHAQPHRSLPLMLWFATLALALISTTVIGIYMAFAYKRDRPVVIGLLLAGIVVPVVFALL